MNRREIIGRLTLNTICDDFENLDQVILREVARDAAGFGFAVERSDIVSALADLVKDGLAKAYLLSPFEPVKELQNMPSLDGIEENFETYFYATKRGIEVNQSKRLSFDD